MIDRIIQFSIGNRWFVMVCAILLAIGGVIAFHRLPIDAVPDITTVQVQINTEVPGYTPLEIEQRVTYLIEAGLSGIPRLNSTRSLSRYGLSQVTAVFEDGTDIYFARQIVSERLQEVRSRLPLQVTPELGPVATGLGEIFMYTVDAVPGTGGSKPSLTELRTAHDWIIRPQIRMIPGVVEVNAIGGYQREYHVLPKVDRLRALGVTLADLVQVVTDNSESVGAGYLERNGEQYLVRVPGQVHSIEDIESLIVSTREGKPIFLKDLADVRIGHELRAGAATQNGSEVVLGTVFMLMGENSREVARRVNEKMPEILRSLPPGITVRPVYDRTTLVDKTIDTVKRSLFEGAILVVAVLFFALGNLRAALVTALVIPLAMLFTMVGMVATSVSANLMSLGALDFGLIVDGSVIIVENCVRRLTLERSTLGRPLFPQERHAVIFDASREVRRATMFGELLITVVYLPILVLTGIEGKMFHPMAQTVIIALVGAMIASVTFVPAAVAIFVRDSSGDHDGVVRGGTYRRLLPICLDRMWLPLTAGGALLCASVMVGRHLGSEFMPTLDEGDIALHALRIPGTSLTQAVSMQKSLEERIMAFPEVSHAFTKIGTADIATDPMPPSVADGFVMLKPRSAWPDPSLPKEAFVKRLEDALAEIPGNNYEYTQPIEMRFNELIAGVRSDVAVKVYGDDLDTLTNAAQAIEKVLKDVSGASDVKVEQTTGLPFLNISIDRRKLSRFGLQLSQVQELVQTALAGHRAGTIFEGDVRSPIVVILPDENRSDVGYLSSLPIALPAAIGPTGVAGTQGMHRDEPPLSFIPLSSVAEIATVLGPNQVSRENGKRRVVVTANVRGRDLGSFVHDASQQLAERISLPPGYWLHWGGQFEHLISARERLTIVVPAALVLVIALLYYSFGEIIPALVVFSGVPFALSGGIIALAIRGIPFSVSAAVGFIALSGVAVLNGLVMVSFIKRLQSTTSNIREAIVVGATQRLRPVMMTALVASLGFLPMAVANGPGAEVQRPLATVVIGGIISSTLLTLILLPCLFLLAEKCRPNHG